MYTLYYNIFILRISLLNRREKFLPINCVIDLSVRMVIGSINPSAFNVQLYVGIESYKPREKDPFDINYV